MLGADGTPDDTGVVEGLDVCAVERAGRCCGTDALDGTHGPLNGGKLAETGPCGSNQLRSEQRALRYVHVVTKLQILTEVERLSHDDVTKGLEHHHGDGATRLEITDDELGKHIQAKLNVREGLDDADGDGPRPSNDQ